MPTAEPAINFPGRQELFSLLPSRKELLRAAEVAHAVGCDERTILRHFDDQKLHGHDINAGAGRRQQIRYRRDSVILFLAGRANYAPSDLRDRLLEVIAKQPVTDLVQIQNAIAELIARRSR